jgi:hypothetical protein
MAREQLKGWVELILGFIAFCYISVWAAYVMHMQKITANDYQEPTIEAIDSSD